jgi:DNA phosphorothioation-dependent restriction protein DptH
MYEQSFSYLATCIADYLSQDTHSAGDRFHVQFERQEDVESLFNALVAKPGEAFSYNGYETRVLNPSGIGLVVAASHNANENFLTSLRNRTAEQLGAFDNKMLLILHHTDLDSIIGGAESLAKETRPLHAASLRQRLADDLETSGLQRHEKLALSGMLKQMRESEYEDVSSVFSYMPFMSILMKGSTSLSDWNQLGLFPDPELAAYHTKSEISKRIQDNSSWFDTVETANRYSANAADDLERYFSSAGVSALTSESWAETSYGKVAKWITEKSSKALPEYSGIEASLLDTDHEIWERGDGETSAARRRRHIIVFNPTREDSFECRLSFDSAVKQSAVRTTKQSPLSVAAKGKQIAISVEACANASIVDQFIYEDHDTSGKYVFNIAILPIAPDFLHAHKATYKVNGSARSRRLLLYCDGLMVFNDSQPEERRVDLEQGCPVDLADEEKTVLTAGDVDEDQLLFDLVYKGCKIPCEVYRDSVRPSRITGVRIWKWKRESNQSFEYAGENKLILGNEEYFTNRSRTRDFLDLERDLINEFPNDCFWTQDKSGLKPKHLNVGEALRKAFCQLTYHYRKHSLLPSLANITPELSELMQQYLAAYIKELSSIEPGLHLSEEKHNLLRIGTIDHSDGERQVYFTPLHPLNIAYQLEFLSRAGRKQISEEILKCLSPSLLLPYINDPNDSSVKLQPVPETELPEWVVYKPCNTLCRGWHNEYVQKLIAEKIDEYIRHFPYLFTGSSKAPVRISLMHMGDCTDALKGIVRHFQRAIEKHNGNARLINPVRLCIYGNHGHCNKFEEFARYSDPQSILRDFEIDLAANKNRDANDVLKVLREKLHFYLKSTNEAPEYAHITFFRFDQNAIEWTYQKMETVKTGASLGGIVNAVPSVFRGQEYLTGFGSKALPERHSDLLALAQSLNALARVSSTHDPYSCDEATFAALREGQKVQLDSVYDASNWVTLIDPKVDLNFFKMHETATDLIVIHYSDQYNNSSGYDAITVTRKSSQYRAILREFLERRDLTPELEDEFRLINMFNAINGDWLLQLIAGRAHFPREKISILSAVKTMLAFLAHPDIVWIPLSLEEVLRVSGGIGLKQSEGLFSAKNLGEKGSYCDDLLMAGVESQDGETVVHLFPVEVKIGINSTSVLDKAKKQGLHTASTLKTFLDPANTDFTSAFYRNFFAKLILTGAEKMDMYGILPEMDWDTVTVASRSDLLNDNYQISWHLENMIGSCAVLSFQKDCFIRAASRDGKALVINLPESDGHFNLLKDVPQLATDYKESTIDDALLLCNADTGATPVPPEPISQNNAPPVPADGGSNTGSDSPDQPDVESEPANSPGPEGMQILFGHDMNHKQPVVWLPNDTDKVMHTNTGIIGTMGTGKTQFTKSMVTQLVRESKNNVNGTQLGFLIFDYKGDYIKDDFMKATGARRFDLHCLPYNPLSLTVTDHPQPMLPLHTANAIKESMATAFHLGTVQKQRLRDCIMEAYQLAGIDKGNTDTWNNPAPTLADVCEIYLSSEDVKSDSLYAAFDNLHQFEIFEPNPSKTKSLFDLLNGVIVINLSGYDQDIQNLVVAITLDQFYSQMQKAGHSTIHGNLREITRMILVDEADNFLSQNFASLRKILKEGREFGVGTILSTQFLNHFSTGDNEYSNYILSWIVHRVSEINAKDVGALFGVQDKGAVAQLVTAIKGLNKHLSVANVGNGSPVFIRDRAFWEIIADE